MNVREGIKNKTIELYGDGIGKVDYVEHMGSDLTIVNSARVSFGVHKQELDDKDKKLIKYLIKHRHTSTLEHNNITFRFKVPLYVRSQHHRHRTWSYNEISRRYTDLDIQFYEPKEFRTQHQSNRQASNSKDTINPKWKDSIKEWYMDMPQFAYQWDPEHLTCSEALKEHHEQCLKFYNYLIKTGVCREQARGVLPQNMYTSYYGTTNLNNLMKFISLRTHEGAQWEIQKVAEACLDIAEELFPVTIGAYREIKSG